jgi:hypothetical protein
MSNSNPISRWREARIQRILNTPSIGFITQPWVRITFSILAVVSSYLFLAALLIPYSALMSGKEPQVQLMQFKYTVGYIAPVVMLISLLILRKSMQLITSVPDSYLDERQIENREWAFRTGYLVVRRVGLALSVLAALAIFTFWITTPRGWSWPQPKGPLWEVQTAIDKYLSEISAAGSLGFFFTVIALLTYVAYSFPIILLAWREANSDVPMPRVENRALREAPSFAKAYYKKLLLVGLGFLATIASGFVPSATYNGLIFYILFIVVGYGIYVYLWTSIKTVEVLKAIKQKTSTSTLAMTFFVITQILGVSILITVIAMTALWSRYVGVQPEINPLGVMLILGLLSVPAQALSVRFVSKLSG